MNPSFLDTHLFETIGSGPHNALERLHQFQLAAIRQTVAQAKKNSGFYKQHLKKICVENISGFDEFTALPFTFAHHIQESSHDFLCVSQDEISRIVTIETSGTTAFPKRMFFTDADLEQTIEFFSFVLSQMLNPGETALILLPGNTPASAGDLLKTAMDRIGVNGIVSGIITDFCHTINTMNALRPSLIIGLPVQVLALCQLSEKNNHIPDCVRDVILTSDYVSPFVKSRIRQILNCRVFDHYGMTETGFGGGIDCVEHKGYHLRETELFFEIIDPDTGRPARKGQWGEIVVTTLGRQGMPLIRYRTGDISRFLRDPCPCGSPFQRMDYIKNRYMHTIALPSGERFGMPDLDDMFFSIPGVVDFDAVLTQKQGIMNVQIVLKAFDLSMIHDIDINAVLPISPIMENAVKAKDICFEFLPMETFKIKDTYTGKRRITDHTTTG
ncbi:MAG: DVU_1553 family AMP-dependent CoA ligase [Pseudomonadota bacterium]